MIGIYAENSYFAGVNAAHAAWQDLGDRSEKHYHGPFFSGC